MELARQMSAVMAVFGLLGTLLWMLRRGGFAAMRTAVRGARSLESIERLALTQNHSLHLVKIRGREVVVATHPNGCAVLVERVEEQA